MALFLSTFVNKIDRKGRVSVPAPWRTALAAQSFPGIVAYPSFKHPCLDCSGLDRMEEIAASIDKLDQFSEEADDLRIVLGSARQLQFDPEGRITLPADLAEHAGIAAEVAFYGAGRSFQIWEPGQLRAFEAAARERLRDQRRTLRLAPAKDGGAA